MNNEISDKTNFIYCLIDSISLLKTSDKLGALAKGSKAISVPFLRRLKSSFLLLHSLIRTFNNTIMSSTYGHQV